MERIYCIFASLLLGFLSLPLQAQHQIRLLDSADQSPIPAAILKMDWKKEPTLRYSDSLGYVQLPGTGQTVHIQHLGYVSKTVRIRKRTKKIYLQPNAYSLKDIAIEGKALNKVEIGHFPARSWLPVFPFFWRNKYRLEPLNVEDGFPVCYEHARLLKPTSDASHYIKRIAVFLKGRYDKPVHLSFYPNLPKDTVNTPPKLCSDVVLFPEVSNDWQYVELPEYIELPPEGIWIAINFAVYKERKIPLYGEKIRKGNWNGVLSVFLPKVEAEDCVCRLSYDGKWYPPYGHLHAAHFDAVPCYLIKADVLVEQP